MLYREFGPAVAAASVAQAHAAVLHDGRRVAVKVLRPGIERRVAADVEAMALGARLADRFAAPARRLEPVAFTAAVARSLELEMDLRLEAAGASELGAVMAQDGYVTAPAVVWEGVGRRVLTLEWVRGRPLSDPATLELPGLDRPALANAVIRGFLVQALDHGVFHADLHEGNLFAEAPAQLHAVDFGIVGRLDAPARRFLAEILWGFLQRDYRRVAQVHFEAGYVPATQNVEDFAQALRAVGEPIFGRPAREVSMGRLLGQLFEITALFDMHLRPELVLLQKTMTTVEGVARRIDPDSDIWEAARPIVSRWVAARAGPRRPRAGLRPARRARAGGAGAAAGSPRPLNPRGDRAARRCGGDRRAARPGGGGRRPGAGPHTTLSGRPGACRGAGAKVPSKARVRAPAQGPRPMKLLASALAASALLAGAASAQTMTTAPGAMAPGHVIAAHKTGPNTAVATTTPTQTAAGKTKVSKTVVKGGPVTRSAASMDCSKQADEQKLHGKARQKMRTACMAAARKG